MSVPSVPRLSVLVPTYNYGDYLDEALRSVVDQHVDGIEIVVVDDGSTDATETVMGRWADHPSVRYHRQTNAGPSVARNTAMQLARAELLMFLDADDVLLDGCVRTTLDFLERHPDVGMFFTNYDVFDSTGVVHPSGVDIWKTFRSLPHEVVEPDGWIFTESLTPVIVRRGSFMHTSGLTVRRAVVEQAGPFRPGYSYGEDDEFYARVAHLTRAAYVDRVLSRKRNHERSLIHAPGHGRRNARHLLELSEIQRATYADQPTLQAILRAKIHDCAVAYAWGSLQAGELDDARATVKRYLPRYPFSLALLKLGARALVGARPRPRDGARP